MDNVERVITIFERGKPDEEAYCGDVVLEEFDLSELQKLFNQPEDEPMVDCFKIEEKHLDYFQDKYGIILELAKFEYYLECNALD